MYHRDNHRDNWPADELGRITAPAPAAVPAIPLTIEGVDAALAQVFERVGELERRLAPVLHTQPPQGNGGSGNSAANPRPTPPLLVEALRRIAERLSELDGYLARLTERLEL